MAQAAPANDVRATEHDAGARARKRWRFARALLFSGLLHAVVLMLLLWRQPATEEAPLPVPVILAQGPEGTSGAAGGGAGATAASSPNQASTAASASATTPSVQAQPQQHPDRPQPQRQAAQPQPPQPTETPRLAQANVAPEPTAKEPIEWMPPRKPFPPRPKPSPAPAATMETLPAPHPPLVQTALSVAPSVPNVTPPGSLLSKGSGGHGRGVAGPGRAAVGNGSLEGLGDDYLELLRRWVARYKRYPPEALKKKEEGVVMLGFVIDRNGNLLDAWIKKSSGSPLLDQATLAMVHASSPVPKPPDRYKGNTLRLFMPVNYEIGFFDQIGG